MLLNPLIFLQSILIDQNIDVNLKKNPILKLIAHVKQYHIDDIINYINSFLLIIDICLKVGLRNIDGC